MDPFKKEEIELKLKSLLEKEIKQTTTPRGKNKSVSGNVIRRRAGYKDKRIHHKIISEPA